ncbi:hypothetical protein J4E91_009385 [Alternaria rosae]|nr:hypothetical protein J4E91_009385 [Alternaria rosae]
MVKMSLINTIRTRHQERKDKRKAVRQIAQLNEKLQSDTTQARVNFTTPIPTQHLPFSGPTQFFSLRRKRGVSIGMPTYEQLPNGIEPALIDHSCHLMQCPSGEELPRRSPFATPPLAGADAASTPNQDTSPKTWLSRVGGSLRRKPGGMRSAFSYTLPRNWKTNSTAASAKALAETAHECKKSQIRRLNPNDVDAAIDDGRGRSPLPHHWRERSSSSVSRSREGVVNMNRMSDTDTTMEGSASEMGDWIDPDEQKREQEFDDWIVYNRLFVQAEGLNEADKRVSRNKLRIFLSLVLITIFAASSNELRIAIGTFFSWALGHMLMRRLSLLVSFRQAHNTYMMVSFGLLAGLNDPFWENPFGRLLDLFFDLCRFDPDQFLHAALFWSFVAVFPAIADPLARWFATHESETTKLERAFEYMMEHPGERSPWLSMQSEATVMSKRDTRYNRLSSELILVCGPGGGLDTVIDGDIEGAISRRRALRPRLA